MRTPCEIQRVGPNVHVWLRSRPSIWGKILLIISNIALLSFWMIALLEFEHKFSPEQTAMGFGLILVLWTFTLARYSLWRLYGEEYLIIGPTSISYQHRYGLFHTQLRTVSLYRPLMFYELTQEYPAMARGIFHVVHHDPATLVPEEVYRSTVQLREADLQSVIQSVTQLSTRDFLDKHGFPGVCLN